MARKVSGMAISPVDGKSVVPVIKKAMAGGIPVITFDSDAAPESGRLAFVGMDNEAAGEELGRLFLRFAPNGTTYSIIIGGLGAVNLNQRIKGFKSVVTDTSKCREVSGSPFSSNDDIKPGGAAGGADDHGQPHPHRHRHGGRVAALRP